MNIGYLWLAIYWIIYFSIHSILATSKVKKQFYSIGVSTISYRLSYNIFSVLTLFPVFFINSSISSEFIVSPSNFTKLLGLFLSGCGIVIVKVAFKSYDTKAFLGLGNIEQEKEFKSDGLLKYVRHPLYSGSILVIFGYFFFNPKVSTLISVVLMVLYFVIGIQFEERKLINSFGDKYLKYKSKTPMLIPHLKIWS